MLRDAERRLQAVMDGVGDGKTIVQHRPIVIHARRSLSDAEIATLSPEWLAIPARDEFSEDGKIETEL